MNTLKYVSLSCPKQSVTDRSHLEHLHSKTNVADRSVEHIRIILKHNSRVIEKVTARLTTLRDGTVVMEVTDFALCLVVCFPL